MKITIAAVAIASIVAGAAGWSANGWRLEGRILETNAKHSQALAAASQDALARYTSMEQKKNEAINEANRKAQVNARAAVSARNERDRLREQISASTYGLSTATLPSIRLYSTTLNTVFGECVAEVERLAQAADGHALDSRTLSEAWPQ